MGILTLDENKRERAMLLSADGGYTQTRTCGGCIGYGVAGGEVCGDCGGLGWEQDLRDCWPRPRYAEWDKDKRRIKFAPYVKDAMAHALDAEWRYFQEENGRRLQEGKPGVAYRIVNGYASRIGVVGAVLVAVLGVLDEPIELARLDPRGNGWRGEINRYVSGHLIKREFVGWKLTEVEKWVMARLIYQPPADELERNCRLSPEEQRALCLLAQAETDRIERMPVANSFQEQKRNEEAE